MESIINAKVHKNLLNPRDMECSTRRDLNSDFGLRQDSFDSDQTSQVYDDDRLLTSELLYENDVYDHFNRIDDESGMGSFKSGVSSLSESEQTLDLCYNPDLDSDLDLTLNKESVTPLARFFTPSEPIEMLRSNKSESQRSHKSRQLISPSSLIDFTKKSLYQASNLSNRLSSSQPNSDSVIYLKYKSSSKADTTATLPVMKPTQSMPTVNNNNTNSNNAPSLKETCITLKSEFKEFLQNSTYVINDKEAAPPQKVRSKSLKGALCHRRDDEEESAGHKRGKKKIVRFADALGLELSEVKTFLVSDPPDPLRQLCMQFDAESFKTPPVESLPVSLLPLFTIPGLNQAQFTNRVRENKICLESLNIEEMRIQGIVRVFNVSFNKNVFVRYTFNNWKTCIDKNATYVEDSSDGFTDKFAFIIYAPTNYSSGMCMEMCFSMNSGNNHYWDNNYGVNYKLECFGGK